VAHFNNTHNRNCTFYTLNNSVNDETFLHLFFSCKTTQEWHTHYLADTMGGINRAEEIEKKLFWFVEVVPGGTSNAQLCIKSLHPIISVLDLGM
jgi:hypothetical protein